MNNRVRVHQENKETSERSSSVAGFRAVPGERGGMPLEPGLRQTMEGHFRTDLGDVRLHTDGNAARSAQNLNAAAYTTGSDVVFNHGVYNPTSPVGQDVLAHELAHVVQQRGGTVPGISQPGDHSEQQAAASSMLGAVAQPMMGGPVPAVQRLTPEERRQMEMDDLTATLTDAMYSSPQHENISLLIGNAIVLKNRFEDSFNPVMPRTRTASARALVRYYHELKQREQNAERGEDNALLYADITGSRPWTEARPRRVEDIPVFSEDNVFDWTTFGGAGALAEEAEQRQGGGQQRRRGRTAPARQQAPPAAGGQRLAITQEDIRRMEEPSGAVASGVSVQRNTPFEQAAAGSRGGQQEINNGLSVLRGANVGQALQAIGTRLNDAAAEDPTLRPINVREGQRDAGTNLLSTSDLIWYVANRVYALDRTGHIDRGQFEFSMIGSNLQPGGVYFYAPFQFQSGNSPNSAVRTQPVLLRLDGGVRVEWGDIFPRSMLVDFIPMLERGRQAFGRNAGIGMVVSPTFGQNTDLTLGDANFDNISEAVRRAEDHVPWAVRSELANIAENPGQFVFEQVSGLVMSKIAQMLPPVRGAMMIYDTLQMAEWLGTTANIAAYGNEDEIDIAAQAIARKLVEWAIGELVSAGVDLAGRGARGLAGRGSGRGGADADVETSRSPNRAGGEDVDVSPNRRSGGGEVEQHPSQSPADVSPNRSTDPEVSPNGAGGQVEQRSSQARGRHEPESEFMRRRREQLEAERSAEVSPNRGTDPQVSPNGAGAQVEQRPSQVRGRHEPESEFMRRRREQLEAEQRQQEVARQEMEQPQMQRTGTDDQPRAMAGEPPGGNPNAPSRVPTAPRPVGPSPSNTAQAPTNRANTSQSRSQQRSGAGRRRDSEESPTLEPDRQGEAAQGATVRPIVPQRYRNMSLDELRAAARTDREAAMELWARYQAMTNRELGRRARHVNDDTARHVRERRQEQRRNPLVERARRRHREADNPEMHRQLRQDIEGFREWSGIRRSEPMPGEAGDVAGGTVGAARTDIPGLDQRPFMGASPNAGGVPDPTFRPPSSHGAAQGHAEQNITGALDRAIARAMADGQLTHADLQGRRVWMHIEQQVCSVCRQGVGTDALPGVLVQFSRRYPELTIVVRTSDSSEVLMLRGGREVTE